MKRILLFIVTNLAVMLVLGIAASLLGVNRFLTSNGLNLGLLLGFAAVMGFGGAIISLLMSKPMAKWSTGAVLINDSADPTHRWIVGAVARMAQQAGIAMPEVALYEGEPNAFATGAFRNSALVAVSTGLLQGMTRDEVEAVIGHEISHVANGDMVTLALIQGVMNTFVVFLSRVIGYFIDKVVLRNDRDGPGIGYYVSTFVLDMVRDPRVWNAAILGDSESANVPQDSTEQGPCRGSLSDIRYGETVLWRQNVEASLGEMRTCFPNFFFPRLKKKPHRANRFGLARPLPHF